MINKDFEKWLKWFLRPPLDLYRDAMGEYRDDQISRLWCAFKAGRESYGNPQTDKDKRVMHDMRTCIDEIFEAATEMSIHLRYLTDRVKSMYGLYDKLKDQQLGLR